jgi:SAM-dependent methyltransferase
MGREARYDKIADFYDGVVGDDLSEPAAAALLDLLPDVRGSRVLDLACGQGRLSRELARRGAHVVGLDISHELLEKARKDEEVERLGIEYLQDDATSAAALADRTFEGVACHFGLSDIDDLGGLAATVSRMLEPDGWFVFSILHPCFPGWGDDAPSSWPIGRGYFAEGWWLADNPGFRGKVGASHRMLSTYLNQLVEHGFSIEKAAEPRPDGEMAAEKGERGSRPGVPRPALPRRRAST